MKVSKYIITRYINEHYWSSLDGDVILNTIMLGWIPDLEELV